MNETKEMKSMIQDIERKANGWEKDRPFLIAIDGRCASGKTTFAAQLSEVLHCPLIHMDDFFLRPEQRSQERYAEPGGNVDRERFAEEVLKPLKEGRPFRFQKLECPALVLGEWRDIPACRAAVIEGSYCLHPELRDAYDLTIFMDIDPEVQLERLKKRNIERFPMFVKKWIPLEEAYIKAFDPASFCTYQVNNSI